MEQPGFEFLDHTADVQIHSWGPTLKEAFEQAGIAMTGYMTEIDKVDINPELEPREAEVNAEDLESLLYQFLEEILFIFSTEFIIFKRVTILEFDRQTFRIKFHGHGEAWNREKHPQGTEIKAITYSAMQIMPETEGKLAELWCIVDI